MSTNKEYGFTLVELMVSIAILAIIISMVGPMLSNLNTVNERERVVNKLDSNLGKSIELIKRTARTAKRSGSTPAIAVTTGGAIRMNVPVDEVDANKNPTGNLLQSLVVFRVNGTNLEIGSSNDGTNPVTYDKIAENITAYDFKFSRRVLRMYLKIDINRGSENYEWKRREIRDSAVTRIDIE